ncbi:hypothetical protein [Salinispora arenicola]|uniref:hypothetical protein n=1 Tax=Salinispora arenicola TaxID=168697 RepID=UPI001E56FFE4|nr:hypothetical protein [Salinispora arenicola]
MPFGPVQTVKEDVPLDIAVAGAVQDALPGWDDILIADHADHASLPDSRETIELSSSPG